MNLLPQIFKVSALAQGLIDRGSLCAEERQVLKKACDIAVNDATFIPFDSTTPAFASNSAEAYTPKVREIIYDELAFYNEAGIVEYFDDWKISRQKAGLPDDISLFCSAINPVTIAKNYLSLHIFSSFRFLDVDSE